MFAIPEFQDAAGHFDRTKFAGVMLQNQLTEPRLLDFVRINLLHDQLLEPARAGMTVPDALVKRVYQYEGETRVADVVEIPFAAAPAPPDPTEADLQQIYQNKPGRLLGPGVSPGSRSHLVAGVDRQDDRFDR